MDPSQSSQRDGFAHRLPELPPELAALEPWLRSIVARLNAHEAQPRAFEVLFARPGERAWGMPRSPALDAARWWPAVITTGPRPTWELRNADGVVLATVEAPPPKWEYRVAPAPHRER